MKKIDRISVFTGALNPSVCRGIHALHEKLPDTHFQIVLHKPSRPLGKLLRNQWKNIKRNGWRWIPYQAADLGKAITNGGHSSKVYSDRVPGLELQPEQLVNRDRISLDTVEDINGSDAITRVRAFSPDLGVSLGAPILKSALFELPSLGTINLHKGKLPDYRGMPPAFWELWNDEQEVGCSIHRMAKKLDGGDLLMCTSVERQPYSTLGGLQATLDRVGVELTCEAVSAIADGRAEFTKQPPGGQTYRKPTLKQMAQLQHKVGGAEAQGGVRGLAKDAVFTTYTKMVAPAPRAIRSRRGDQRIVVLMYHRVNDELRDGVTVGIEQFDRQMAWLRRRYPLVSVDRLASGDFPTDCRRPLVAVTFDDGYRDNYLNAAPILLKHQVPATFFVSTGLMGSEQGFQHDMSKLGRPLENMNWDQLREMTEMGFDIGSHTVNHINCGKMPLEVVKRELIESQQKLRDELHMENVLFAYPFGGRTDIVPEVVSYVKEIGYRCCMSAYGGVNTARGLDVFNILRAGVNYNFSKRAFEARLEGWA